MSSVGRNLKTGGKKMGNVIAYLLKNAAILVGIVEAVLKAAAGIVSLTPTKADDAIVGKVNDVFNWVKSKLYDLSDSNAE